MWSREFLWPGCKTPFPHKDNYQANWLMLVDARQSGCVAVKSLRRHHPYCGRMGIRCSRTNTALVPKQTISTAGFIFLSVFLSVLLMDPPSTPPPPPPQHRELSRDKRLRIRLLKNLHWKHTAIAEHEGVSLRQISQTVNHIHVTPQKHLLLKGIRKDEQYAFNLLTYYLGHTGGRPSLSSCLYQPPLLTPEFRHLYNVKSKLDHIQIQVLIQFISASRINRRIPYFQVAAVLDWPDVGEYAIQHALEKKKYNR